MRRGRGNSKIEIRMTNQIRNLKFGMGMTDRIALRKSTGKDYREDAKDAKGKPNHLSSSRPSRLRGLFSGFIGREKGGTLTPALSLSTGRGGNGMSSFWFLVSGLTVFFLCASAWGQTQPAGELLQSKAAMPGYGAEVYRIVSGPDEIVSVLRNGAVVICKRVASPVAAVRGYAETGGVYEGQWLGGGLSHLLEHLVAGGSSERRTETENKKLLQEIGNDSNAYTTYDHTAFFVNTTTPHFAQAVDLVTGWMLGAQITYPEYTREYQVVQRELERNKGNPDMVFWQLTQENRYKVSPAHVPVIGYQEVIQGLSAG